ncbi:zf-RING_2 domain-containing protein, partial [Cephalotus follicularis]
LILLFIIILEWIQVIIRNRDNENRVTENHQDIEAITVENRQDIEVGTTVTAQPLILPHLPTIVYVKSDGEKTVYNSDDCVICLEDFKNGDECTVLAHCKHMYHKSCISQWLLKHIRCPLCR